MKPNRFGWLLVGSMLVTGPLPLLAQPCFVSTLLGSATDPGSADGTNGAAQFTAPTGVALDAAGSVYVLDGNALRRITFQGANRVVETLAGSVHLHALVDGTNAAARFNAPQGVALDAAGNVYVADTFNNALRKISPVGTDWVVTTLAGPTPPSTEFGAADGTNNAARFHNPYGIAVDAAANVYVADTLNHTIRKLSPVGTNWVVTTLAGAAGKPGSADGTNAAALFNNPTGLAVDAAGDVYVADFGNNLVRKMSLLGTNWVVSTLAGSISPGIADGPGALAAFNAPQCLALDSAGNLFLTDSGNYTVRKITPQGLVSTLAGSPGLSGSADGVGQAALFALPYGIAASPAGTLFIADYLGYSIRQGTTLPLLRIARTGEQITLSWPATPGGFVLQSSPALSGDGWQDHTNGVTLSSEFQTLTEPLLPGASFYRLRFTGP